MWCEGKKILKTVTGVAAAAVLAVMFTTCNAQVGLGEQVDTEVPTLSILYPPDGASAIKGMFILSGSCSDDQAVTSVKVTITNTELATKYGPYTATLGDTKKTWEMYVNQATTDSTYNGWTLPDGKYTVSVIAYDNAEHQSAASERAYEIDNTAPVFILKSPGSSAKDSPTAYGANFKISGQIADDHVVKTMAVTVYDKDGKVVGSSDTAPFTSTNLDNAGTVETYIARYLKDGTTELNSRYNTIYNNGSALSNETDSETHGYTCAITLTDKAKEYADSSETENTSAGNSTSTFFLYDDVHSTLSTYDLEASDVKKILNGTYTGTNTAAIAAVKTLFESKGKSIASFSLNPDASPKYSVTGYKFVDLKKGYTSSTTAAISDNSASAEQKVTVSAVAGRDATYVNPATLMVYLFGPFSDVNDLAVEDSTGATLLSTIYTDPAAYAGYTASSERTPYSDSSYYDTTTGVLTNGKGFVLKNQDSTDSNPLFTNTAYSSGSTESYTYPVVLYSTIVTGNFYVVAVAGTDVDNADITPQDGYYYGFTGAISGNPPTIKWPNRSDTSAVNVADLGYINTSALSFSGTASSAESTIKSVAYTVTVTNESNTSTNEEITTYSGNASAVATSAETTGSFDSSSEGWTIDISANSGYSAGAVTSGKEYLYTVDITVTDANGNKTQAERRIHVDAKAPSVIMTQVTPGTIASTIESVSRKCVNGTFKVGGSVYDANLSDVKYTVSVNGTVVKELTSLGAAYSFNPSIDTTSFTDADKKPVVVTVYAYDKAGNESSYSTTDYNGGTNSLYIDQSTDAPIITFSNADTAINTDDKTGNDADGNEYYSVKSAYSAVEKGTKSYSNIFDAANNNTLRGTITDDDGIKTVTVGYRVYGTTDYTNKEVVSDGSSTSYTLNYVLPKTYNAYDIKVSVVDTAGEATNYSSTYSSFVVSVDDGAPTFSNVTPTDGGYYKGSGKLETKGTIKDASGVITLQHTSTSETTGSSMYQTAASLTVTSGVASFDDTGLTAPASDGSYELVYTATDKYGQRATYTIKYNVDTVGPTFLTYTTDPEMSGDWISTTSPKITVPVSDIDNTSGTGSGVSSVQCSYGTTVTTLTSTNTNSDNNKYSDYYASLNLAEGTNTVTINAYDQASNKSTYASVLMFKVDTLAPSITAPSGYDTKISATDYASLSGGLVLTPVVTDAGSGVSKIWLSTKNTVYSTTAEATAAYTVSSIKADDPSTSQSLTIPQTDLSDGVHTYYVHAMDVAGRNSVSSAVTFTVDTKAPVLSGINLTSNTSVLNSNGYVTKKNDGTYTYSVRGTWSDEYAATSTLDYSVDSGATWKTVDSSTAPKVTDAASWSQELIVTESTGNSIWFRAADAYGNQTAEADYYKYSGITFDFNAPVITEGATVDTIINRSENLVVKGTVTDTLALSSSAKSGTTAVTGYGITITAKKDGVLQDISSYVTFTPDANTLHTSAGYNLTIPKAVSSGAWVVSVGATDAAGQTATAKEYSITVDSEVPTIVFTDTTARYVAKSVPQSFEGTMSDNTLATNVYYLVTTDAANPINLSDSGWKSASIDTTGSAGVAGSWSATINMSGNSYSADTQYYVYFGTKDAAGNIAVAGSKASVTLDAAKPVLSDIALTVSGTSVTKSNAAVTVSGTITETQLASLVITYSFNGTDKGTWYEYTVSALTGLSASTAEPWSQILPKSAATDTLNTLGDGIYIFTITATDKAGQTAEKTSSALALDTTAPKIASVNISSNELITEENSALSTSGGTFSLTGTITDFDTNSVAGVGATKLYYKWNTDTDYTAKTLNAITNGTYTVSIPAAQGISKTLSLKVEDSLGNSRTLDTITGIKIDYAKPVVSITTSPASTVKLGDTISIAGTVYETNGLASASPYGVTLILKKGSTEKTFTSSTYNSGSFSAYYTAGTGDDGDWTITVYATDVAGRVSDTKTYTSTIDATPPAVTETLTTHSSYYAKAVPESYSGTMSNDVSTVKYLVQTSAETVPASYDSSNTNWKSASIDTATTWSATVNLNSAAYLANTKYTIFFAAIDAAGNTTLSASNYQFILDDAKPVVTITPTAATTSKSAVTLSGTVTEANLDSLVITYSLNGTDKGTWYEYTSSTTTTIASLCGTTAVNWTCPTTVSNDGVYVFTITAKDKVSNETTAKSASVQIDKTAPSFSVTNLIANASIYETSSYLDTTNNKFSLRGTWKDVDASSVAGTGTNKFHYTWSGGSSAAEGDFTVDSVTTEASFVVDLPVVQGAGQTLTLYATDKLGNQSANTVISGLTFDYAVPTVKFGTITQYTKQSGTLTVNATVEDTYKITASDNTIVVTKGGTSQPLLADSAADETAGYRLSTSQDTTKKITYTFTVKAGTTQKNDGTWVFKVTAKDGASRSATADTSSSSCIIDSLTPSVSTFSVGSWSYDASAAATKYFKDNSLTVSGTVAEMSAAAGSGIAGIYYKVNTSADTINAVSGCEDTPMSAGSVDGSTYATSFKSNLSGFAAGTNYLHLLPVDNAGNIGTAVTYTIKVDQTSPSLVSSSPSGSQNTNALAAMSVTGVAADDTGIAKVSVLVDGKTTSRVDSTPVDANEKTSEGYEKYTWGVTLPVSDLSGSNGKQVQITITDVAGNSTKLTAFTLKVDDVAPTATITSSVSSLNGTLDIKGTTDDGSNTPASMRLYYSIKKSGTYSGTLDFAGGSTTTASDSPATYGWTAVPTTAGGTTYQYTDTANVLSWKYTGFDFSTLSGASSASDGKATMYLLPVVVDAAGNCNAYTMSYDETSGTTTYTWTLSAAAVACTVDMNSDRPQIKTTNLSSDNILKYGTKATINGTVNDDDSASDKIVKTFIACESQITAVTDNGTDTYTCTIGGSTYPFTYASSTDASGNSVITVTSPSAATTSDTKYGITTYTPATGAWTFMPSDVNDGPHTMYFYVIDNNSTVFYTNKSGSSSVLYDPYITLNGGTQTDNTAVISYNSDSNAPAVGEIKVAYCSTSAGDYTDYASFSAGSIMGGTVKKYAKFEVTASDANGIKSVQLTLTDSASTTKTSGSTFSGTSTITSSGGDFVISGNKTTTSTTSAWTTDAIDLSQFTTGLVSVIAKPTDNSDMYGNGTNSFYNDYKVDMSSFKVSSPSADSSGLSNDIMTSDVTLSGIAGDGSGAGISTIKWMVPATGVTAANVTASPSSYTWQGKLYSGSTATAWQFLFDADGDANAATDANNPQFTTFTKVYSSYAITRGTGVKESVYYIPIYFELTDALGNVGVYTGYTMQYNPNANWPTAKIVYPTTGSTVGNTIRVTGSATDNNSVSAVYVQIGFGTSTSDVTWVREDTQGLISSCVTGGDFTVTSADDSGIVTETNGSSSAYGDGTSWWGIKVTNTTSWYLVLNKSKVLNTVATKYKNGSTNGKMFLRTCAVDNESLCGLWSSVVALDVDTGVPEISEPYLAQFSGATPSSAAQTAYKPYSVDMYVTNTTGQWYLVAKAADDGSIKDYTITQAQGGSAATDYTSSCTAEALTYTDTITYTGYTFYIPITTTKEGTLTYVIDTIDNDDKESKYTCTLTVDTTAPALGTLEAESGNLKISTSTQVAGNKLVNSDGAVTLESSIVDATSGFSRFAYYFVRNSTVYNAIPSGSSSGWTMAAATGYAQSGLTNKDNMYGLEADGGTISGVTYTSSSVSGNANIRAGGLAKINGVYYRIASVSGSAVTLEADSLSTVSSGNTAFFPYALSLRYKSGSSSEYYATGSGSSIYTISSDDGDGVVETTTKSGTKYTWNLSVLSGAFDDGPITIVLVAFDNAGNISTQTVNTMIANKTPRLSKVFLGTDLNSDGSFANDEFAYTTAVNGADTTNYSYSALDTANGNIGKEYVTLTTTNANAAGTSIKFSARDKLAVTMEFIDGEGGQGTVSYIAKLASAAATAPATGTVTGSLGTVSTISDSAKITNTGILFANTDITGLSGYAASMENNSSGGVTNLATQTYLQLSLWDQATGAAGGTADTTGTVDGTSGMVTTYGNQFTVLNVPFYLDIADDQNPTVTLDNLTKDSVYESGGHVEASSSLPAGNFGAYVKASGTFVSGTTYYSDLAGTTVNTSGFTAGTTDVSSYYIARPTSGYEEFDLDDKISGQVVFTGTVSDNMHIGNIYLEAANTTAAASPTQYISGLLGAAGTSYRVLVASYDTTTGSSTKGTLVFDTKYTKTNFAAGTYNFYFIKTGETFTQAKGHVVTWEMGVDTSKVTSIAATDIIFDVYTVDGNALSGEKTKQCDIVPYITEITRNATTNSVVSKTYRSTYGEYPVALGDQLSVTGFNFAGTSAATVKVGGTTLTTTSTDNTSGSYNSLTITAPGKMTFYVPANSGELTITENSIVNLNAKNNNAMANNHDATTTTNYDNCYLRVWDVNHYFSNSTNGYKPTMVVDNTGTPISSWTLMGSASVQLQKGVTTTNEPIYVCYDQPDKINALSVDTKSTTTGGAMSAMYFPANVGSSGTPDSTGYADARTLGGAWGTGIPSDITSGYTKSVVDGHMRVKLTGNPYTDLDDKVYTAGWQLASYSMRREVSLFDVPRTVRYKDNMHFAYYDTQNKALRYTYQPYVSGVSQGSDDYRYVISGWTLIDGTSDGQDRVHTRGTHDYSSKLGDITYSNCGTNSVTIGGTYASSVAEGDTIGISNQSSTGKYCFTLHNITSYTDNVASWTDSSQDTTGIDAVTVYSGDVNYLTVEKSGLASTTSAGAYIGIDTTTSGYPVIVYYDATHETLRIAYCDSTTPSMTAAPASVTTGNGVWHRQYVTSGGSNVSGGTYVQSRIDGKNYLHILYRRSDGNLCYQVSTNTFDGSTSFTGYTFGTPQEIESSGTYGTLSLIRSGTSTYTYTPCVSFLNSEGTANGVKFAVLRTVDMGTSEANSAVSTSSVWDTGVMPAVKSHYISGGELVYVAGYNGWTASTAALTDSVNTSACDAIVSYNTGRMDVLFLKSEK